MVEGTRQQGNLDLSPSRSLPKFVIPLVGPWWPSIGAVPCMEPRTGFHGPLKYARKRKRLNGDWRVFWSTSVRGRRDCCKWHVMHHHFRYAVSMRFTTHVVERNPELSTTTTVLSICDGLAETLKRGNPGGIPDYEVEMEWNEIEGGTREWRSKPYLGPTGLSSRRQKRGPTRGALVAQQTARSHC